MFQTSSHIQKIQTLVDGGNKLTILTQELEPDQMTELFKLTNKVGWFLFKEQAITEEDVKDLPEIKPEFKGEKTPSQRLRNIIFVYWEQQGGKGNFDDFYKKQINKLIDKIKDLLN
jgi:hypothetical protein